MLALSQHTTRTFQSSQAGRNLFLGGTRRPAELCIFCSQTPLYRILSRRERYISSSTRYHQPSNPIPQPRRESARPRTFYELFPQSISKGPPPQGPFAVDVRLLRTEFLRLQAQAHPDRHPQEAKNRAEATSAYINEAYKTLQNPLLRAQYLLSLRGIDVANDETAKVEDPDLLMEVLEAREQIEEAEEEEHLSPLRETNDARIEESLRTLDDAFKTDDLDRARDETTKLRYWMNIKESLDNWEKGKPVVLIH